MIKLLIADDHQVLLDGFISIFDSIDDIEVVATAHNGQEVLDYLDDHPVDLVLLDINMPVLNGVETCKIISKRHSGVKVVALSMYDQQSYFKRMMQYGAMGYLLKNDAVEEIERAIRLVLDGERYVSTQLRDLLSSINFLAGNNKQVYGSEVSPRELEVLQWVAEGFTDPQIAEKLFISNHTVSSHRKNLILKFDAKNTAELVKKALERGII
ncbi:MAG: response regulator transcription factor [Saprospiraceae bacterium]|nr:response regulator transcription factor [Saprospiraceae bacterium]